MAGIKIVPRILEYTRGVFETNPVETCVELAEDCVRIAESKFVEGKRQLTLLAARPFSPKSESAAADLKNIFSTLNIASRNVRLNIPRHLVTVRVLRLPSTNDEEIRGMARTEALKAVPYADEDIVSGYRIIEKKDDGFSDVVIAIAQALSIRESTELLKLAGYPVSAVSLGSEALLLWYLQAHDPGDGVVTLLVNAEADHAEIDIVSGEKLLFTRGILLGSVSTSAAEKIASEIKVSISACQKEKAAFVEKIVIAGASPIAGELKDLLAVRPGVPVELVDQTKNCPIAAGAVIDAGGSSFAELIGLVLRGSEANISLMPDVNKDEARVELIKRNILSGAVISALILILAFSLAVKKVHDKAVYVARIDAELAKIEPQIKAAKRMVREMEIVSASINERPPAIELLTEVINITPANVSITMMEYEKGKAMTMRGYTSSLSDVFKYSALLEKSPYFENVKVRYANKRIGPSAGERADFEIACPIVKEKGKPGTKHAAKKSK